MDDKSFHDQRDAFDWIRAIESDNAKVRENDIYPRLREWLNQNPVQEILDLGSGQGICSEHIALGSRNYTGLEPSSFMVERARELYAQANRKFVLGNIYKMPFSDGVFDGVFSVSLWHLLSNLNQACAELSRVLKSNGHFLIITANPDAYSLWTSQYTETALEGIRLDGKVVSEGQCVSKDTLYLHTLDSIISALEVSDLKVSKIEQFRLKPNGQNQYVCIEGYKRL